MKEKTSTLHFDVSTGLKDVLGSELITNDEVAIFELVKNSFDANATKVEIFFGNDEIIISDNGDGMSLDDIKNKWLFVAYSSKRSAIRNSSYREDISTRRHYAGSKGIGRFSTDRLGATLRLQSSSIREDGIVHELEIDWKNFELNPLQHFDDVSVKYSMRRNFEIPPGLEVFKNGTSISIRDLRRSWLRDDILRLKADLAKLINPFGDSSDNFEIIIISPGELKDDERQLEKNQEIISSGESLSDIETQDEIRSISIVNGKVGNFIFSTLQSRTTFISVVINSEANEIETTLTDRNEMIYKIREKNPFDSLREVGFRCQLFYLNLAAKNIFKRRMGISSYRFGSVFVFRNGFRVYPIGSSGDDAFGIDRRKQLGFRRYLGTRELIGRIDVVAKSGTFEESSSRNTGFIDSIPVRQLDEMFIEYCLKRLERYVVPVTFGYLDDNEVSDLSRLMLSSGKVRVTSAVAKLVDSNDIELIDFNRQLISILDERSSRFEEATIGLRTIADKIKDNELLAEIEEAEKKFLELKAAEEAARQQADDERREKQAAQAQAAEAQQRALQAEAHATAAQTALEEEKKRNLFLTSIASLDQDTILSLHHQITIYAVNVQHAISNSIKRHRVKKEITREDFLDIMDRLSLLNKKIAGVATFATRANFRLSSEYITADLSQYIAQYLDSIVKEFFHGPTQIETSIEGNGFEQKFKPIDISVVLDNLVSNSKKARATLINVKIVNESSQKVVVYFSDNGSGLSKDIDSLEMIFEKGVTRTNGSGLGLFHVRMVLSDMNGAITAMENKDGKGLTFVITITKKERK
ncbi:ATP-binding protein [Deinococcus sp. 12RED42]|nr:ATP-binding protein [Deinococcus sp. 12RED42]